MMNPEFSEQTGNQRDNTADKNREILPTEFDSAAQQRVGSAADLQNKHVSRVNELQVRAGALVPVNAVVHDPENAAELPVVLAAGIQYERNQGMYAIRIDRNQWNTAMDPPTARVPQVEGTQFTLQFPATEVIQRNNQTIFMNGNTIEFIIERNGAAWGLIPSSDAARKRFGFDGIRLEQNTGR